MTRRVTVEIRSLHDPRPDSGLSGTTTAEERLLMVEALTRECFALAGQAGTPGPPAEWPVTRRPLRGTGDGR